MAIHEFENIPSGTVARYGVRNWLDTVESIFALRIGGEHAAHVSRWLIGILLVIQSVDCTLPDVQRSTYVFY